MRLQDGDDVRPLEGRVSREHFERHYGERMLVGARPDFGQATSLLGCHVGWRPGAEPARTFRGVVQARDPEVDQPWSLLAVVIVGEQDVGGLQVAMDDAARARLGQRFGDAVHDEGDLGAREHAPLQAILERLPVQQLHHDVGHVSKCDRPRPGHAIVEQSNGVRASEAVQRLSFSDETISHDLVGERDVVQDLDGDLATQRRLDAAVDRAVAPTADDVHQGVLLVESLPQERRRRELIEGRLGDQEEAVMGAGQGVVCGARFTAFWTESGHLSALALTSSRPTGCGMAGRPNRTTVLISIRHRLGALFTRRWPARALHREVVCPPRSRNSGGTVPLSSRTSISILLASWPSAILAAGQGAPAVETPDRLYEQAVAAVQAGHPETALAIFKEVLAITDESQALYSVTIYGAGRAASMMDDREAACDAVEFYSRYVGLADSEADKRKRAVKDLPGLQARCQPAESLSAAPTADSDLDERLADEPPQPASSFEANKWKIAGWTAVGAGAVAMAVSGFFWSSAFDARDAAAGVEPNDRVAYKRHASDMESANGKAVGLTLAGGLLAAAGAYLVVWPPE